MRLDLQWEIARKDFHCVGSSQRGRTGFQDAIRDFLQSGGAAQLVLKRFPQGSRNTRRVSFRRCGLGWKLARSGGIEVQHDA